MSKTDVSRVERVVTSAAFRRLLVWCFALLFSWAMVAALAWPFALFWNAGPAAVFGWRRVGFGQALACLFWLWTVSFGLLSGAATRNEAAAHTLNE